MQKMTNSRAKAARRCFRYHFYSYEITRRPKSSSEALRFGTLFHVALEAWWKCFLPKKRVTWKDPDYPLQEAISQIQGKFDESGFDGEDWRFDVMARVLMVGYHRLWRANMNDLEVIAVEKEFTGPLVNPATGAASRTFEIGGKIDAMVRDTDGDVYLVEHKTSSQDINEGSDYRERLRMDSQISAYLSAEGPLGFDLDGCLYDIVRKPSMKPYKATPEEDRKYTTKDSKLKDGTLRPAGSLYANQRARDETREEFFVRMYDHVLEEPHRYFQRPVIARSKAELTESKFDFWHMSKSIRERQLDDAGVYAWPRNPDACYHWSNLCEYYRVCTGEADIEDDLLFKTTSRHEELTPAK